MNNNLDNNQQRRTHGPPVKKTSYESTTNKLCSQVEEDVALQNSLSTISKPAVYNLRDLLLPPRSLERVRSRGLVENNPIVQATCSIKSRMFWEVSNRDPVLPLNLTRLSAHKLPSMLMASTA